MIFEALIALAFAAVVAETAVPAPAGQVVTAPRLLGRPPIPSAADYPPEAMQAGAEGSVRTMLTVGAEGRVTGCRIVAGSGFVSLDRATCRFLTRARYRPARDAAGRAVEAEVASSLDWKTAPETVIGGGDRSRSRGTVRRHTGVVRYDGRSRRCRLRPSGQATDAIGPPGSRISGNRMKAGRARRYPCM